jgi:hypothetical protein
MVFSDGKFSSVSSKRAFFVWSFLQHAFSRLHGAPRILRTSVSLCFGMIVASVAFGSAAQTVSVHEWRGIAAKTREPEQILATTPAEWRSLWMRVGQAAPEDFEMGQTTAIGIFLGSRSGTGYSVNIISASHRRDRFMVVFEERAPADVMMAQRMPPAPRPVASAPGFTGSGAGFAPQGIVSLPPVPPSSRPVGPITSPWAIILINRADLPVTVEQRLFR